MKNFFSKLIVLCGLIIFCVSINVFAQESQVNDMFKNADPWALHELEEAYEHGLIPENLLYKDFCAPVTRGEFASISVKLYEKQKNSVEVQHTPSPFADIKDNENFFNIEKAYALGITAGVSDTLFDPNAFITREQISTMLCRVFKKYTYTDWSLTNDKAFPLLYKSAELFADDEQISDYAKEAVYFLSENNVIYGMGNNKFSESHEDDYATVEQAILLSLRCTQNLFTEDVLNTARLYPNVSESNKIPYIEKFTIDNLQDIEEALLYDKINYLKITSANINDFSFLKDMNIKLLQILYNEQHPIDFKYINANTIEQLYFYDVDIENADLASTFTNLFNFILCYSKNKAELRNLDFLSECVKMQYIEIKNCGITNLDFAKNMTQLSSLSIINSSLEDINGISTCTNLTNLILRRGKIKDISVLQNLENLVTLDVGDNYIESIDDINTLLYKSLKSIDADQNYITEINLPDVFLEGVFINLSENYISELPQKLLEATLVNLSHNNIQEIPDELKEALKSAVVQIDLFDNLFDEATIREISENENVYFGHYDVEQSVAFSNKIREIMPLFNVGTEHDKVIKITKYVTDNLTLDYSYSESNNNTAYGALFEKAVCTGSTDLTNTLCRHAGIRTKSYHGDFNDYYDNERHVWTCVNINGNYYHCDALQSVGNKDEYGVPRIVLLTDEEVIKYGHILDALNL